MHEKLCFGCKLVLPIEDFYRRSENHDRFYSKCKVCHNKRNCKRVSILRYLPFLDEIIFRCGSQRKAAKRLGIAKSQLRLWIGAMRRYESGKRQLTISRESARRIVATLKQLRQANVYYIHDHQPGPKPAWLKINDADAERKRQERAA